MADVDIQVAAASLVYARYARKRAIQQELWGVVFGGALLA